jgi:hypothetical protein
MGVNGMDVDDKHPDLAKFDEAIKTLYYEKVGLLLPPS